MLFRIRYAVCGGFLLPIVAGFIFWLVWSAITKTPMNPKDLYTELPLLGFIPIAAFFFILCIIGIRMGWTTKEYYKED
ncbi:MAG: hypothetical protein HYS60_03110 [Candidatus Wildermuthbacteria bacterium]|nr:hypothetical protein [Candidatus Wildermuthbacteria bacterium]